MRSTSAGGNQLGPARARGTGLPRLADVAERAGVSKMTASRVLREAGPVAPATRARVERAMRELGYIPNIIASNLASNRTGMIAAMTPGFASPLIHDLFHGLSGAVHAQGYHLLFGVTEAGEGEDALIRAFLARRPDALVLTHASHAAATRRLLRAAAIPIVEAGQLAEKPIDMTVGFDNEEAACALTRHLIASGYRRIAMISEQQDARGRARARRSGYVRALREADLAFDPALLITSALRHADAALALRRLLQRSPPPDAVFCSDDLLALGALFECQRQGWRVPDRVAIAGFGDLEFAAQACPAITTVRVDRVGMGRRAGMMLLSALQGARPTPRSVDVGFTVVARAST